MDNTTRLVEISSVIEEARGMGSAAKIINLADYRQKRAEVLRVPSRGVMIVPVFYVAWWTVCPVMLVPGYA